MVSGAANEPSYSIVLSDDQKDALAKVDVWLATGVPRPERLSLGGYAGTGKTTLVRYIIEASQGRRIGVCALTGKAAYVLRSKGIDATTMHRMIYHPVAGCEACGMAATDFELAPAGWWCSHPVVTVEFVLNPVLPYDLVIVDEASMVNRRLMEDLEGFGVPVLYVGDHGQLEPIGDNPGLMLSPDIRIEQIHRQAEGSPILQLAHHVRQGHRPETTGAAAQVIDTGIMPKDAHEYDAIICGFNATRVAINAKIRSVHGLRGPGPQEGDRLICLRNDHERGLFNGMLVTCDAVRVARRGGHDVHVLDCTDDLGTQWESLPYLPAQFGCEETLRDTPARKVLFDYGYCLTCHKCQGSEFDRVLVLEQIGKTWNPARWRYTAITRAAKEITYCVNLGRSRRCRPTIH